MANGNGINFDINDDAQFRTFCVSKLLTLDERTKDLPEIRVAHAVLKAEVEDALKAEVEDLRKNADWADTKQWIHSIVVLILTRVKAMVFHGKI